MRIVGKKRMRLLINIRYIFGYFRRNFRKNTGKWIELFLKVPLFQLSIGFIIGTIISHIILSKL